MHYLFGKGDLLCFPVLDPKGSVLSKTTFYTKPSLEAFYSPYGFAFPLTQRGLPLDVILDNKFPVTSPHVTTIHEIKRYVLIDHNGMVWRVIVQQDLAPAKGQCITHSYIDTKHSGWWLASEDCEALDNDRDALLGFLYTDPSNKKINHYAKEHWLGSSMKFMSIEKIVEKLNRKFPKPSPEKVAVDVKT